jgi:hypothetical protein
VNAAWLRFGEEASNDLLAAQGLESVLLTKDESELMQGLFALPSEYQQVVQELVDSLHRLEEATAPQKSRRGSGGGK